MRRCVIQQNVVRFSKKRLKVSVLLQKAGYVNTSKKRAGLDFLLGAGIAGPKCIPIAIMRQADMKHKHFQRLTNACRFVRFAIMALRWSAIGWDWFAMRRGTVAEPLLLVALQGALQRMPLEKARIYVRGCKSTIRLAGKC